jgi:diadenosine tetraphosphate (Ap4A) HIT family hydrolase
VLLEEKSGFPLRRVGSGERITLTHAGEQYLDEWMGRNAFVAWVACPEPWVLERVLLGRFSCPLNQKDNNHHSFDREASCEFCKIDKNEVVAENELCLAIRDGYPVTRYHTLVLPKRHVANFFELYQPELNAVHALLHNTEAEMRHVDQSVKGFNVGINVGHDAGQTVFHVHVHLIPRRYGDVESPRGGVRSVIPGKHGLFPTSR